MVKTTKTWETVYSTATNGTKTAVVELTINHSTLKYTIRTDYEEHVSFDKDNIEIAELKIKALRAAIKYLKDNFVYDDLLKMNNP